MNTVNCSTKALFSNIMEGATFGCVDPRACFPLTNIREIVKSGVIRFKAIFRGLGTSSKGLSQGFVSGSNCSIVIEISSNLKSHLVSYLENKGLTKEEVENRISSRAKWYGIVDGLQCHRALSELAVEYPQEWEHFQWPVLILNGSPSVHVLRQLARHNNARNDKCFYIESVPSDILLGMRKEFDRLLSLSKNRSRPSYTEVASAFDGIEHKKQQVRSKSLAAATIVGKVAKEVIEELAVIMNTEHPHLYADVAESNLDGTNPTNTKIMEQLDCRVFRNFISINAINRCTSFVNESHFNLSEEKRTIGIYNSKNALHRVAYIYTQEKGHLKGIGKHGLSSTVLADQLSMAKKAAAELTKFEEFLDGTPFPKELDALKTSILRSTKFDEKINSNIGNDDKILPELQEAYKHEFPLTYHVHVSKFARSCKERNKQPISQEGDTTQQCKDTNTMENDQIADCTIQTEEVLNIGQNEEAQNPTTIDKRKKRQIHVENTLEDEKVILNQKTTDLARNGIFAFNMTWEMYYNIVHHPNDVGVDFILSDPGCIQNDTLGTNSIVPAKFDDHEDRCSFAKFCKEVLVPGGYVMLFGTIEDIVGWKKAFNQYSFQVMPWPGAWLASKGIPDRSITIFPQNNLDLFFLAKAPGNHPKGFKCDIESGFETFPGRRRHCCAGSIDMSTKKLLRPNSKSPFRTDERNPNLLRDYIVSFSPVHGRVMDPLAGTLTCGLAASDCGRNVIVIDNDEECFKEALDRLYNYAVHLEDNTISTPTSKLRRTNNIDDISLSRNSTPKTSTSLNGIQFQHSRITRSSGKLLSDTQVMTPAKLASSSSSPASSENPNVSSTENDMELSSNFDPGQDVTLLLDNKEIGKATLQAPSEEDDGPFRRSLHLKKLNTWDDHNTHYVSAYSFKILEEFKSLEYPYPSIGIEEEESPTTLGDLQNGSFHIWNAYEMKRM